MAHIFISYRRDDAAGHVGRLYDDLSDHFGSEHIFMDIDALEPGEDFVERIETAISTSDVLLAVIGKRWLTSMDVKRRRRLHHSNNFVRLEIAAALRRNARVIPVLVQSATMPRSEDLPDDIAGLARRQAHDISDTRWRSDTRRLIDTLERVLSERVTASPTVAEAATEMPSDGTSSFEQAPDAPRAPIQEPEPAMRRHASAEALPIGTTESTSNQVPPASGETSPDRTAKAISVRWTRDDGRDSLDAQPFTLMLVGWFLGGAAAGAILRDSAEWSEILTTDLDVHLVPARLVGGVLGGLIGGAITTLAFAHRGQRLSVRQLLLISTGAALGGPGTGAIAAGSAEWSGVQNNVIVVTALGGLLGGLVAAVGWRFATTRRLPLVSGELMQLAGGIALVWLVGLWIAEIILENDQWTLGMHAVTALGGVTGGIIAAFAIRRSDLPAAWNHTALFVIGWAILAGLGWQFGGDSGHASVDLMPRWAWVVGGLGVILWLAYQTGLLRARVS